jgi:hypothetical protein
MPLSTSLECPHCGHSTKTSKLVLPIAKIRCPKCQKDFAILALPAGLVETIRVADEPKRDPILELTEAGGGGHNPHLEESALPPLPRAPMPAPTAPAKSALENSSPPFRGARTVLAAIGGFCVLAVAVFGYAAYYSTLKALTGGTDAANKHRTLKYKPSSRASVGSSPAPNGSTRVAPP